MKYETLFIDSTFTKPPSKWVGSTQVNGDQLARDIDAALLEMEEKGYELVNSMPVISGKIHMSSHPFSYTEGVTLIFKQKAPES